MNIWTYKLENHEIKVNRRLLFKEEVFLDSKSASTKITFWGTRHQFVDTWDENETQYNIKTSCFGLFNEIYKNKELIVKGNKNSFWIYTIILYFLCRFWFWFAINSNEHAENFGRFISRLFSGK